MIKEGDIVFYLNGREACWSWWIGVYFTNTAEIEEQKERLQQLLESPKRMSLKLIDAHQFAYDILYILTL